jgi:hypothetical protein
MNVANCTMIDLPKITDARGSLTFIEGGHIPFEIRRVFYMYDVPVNAERGGHAHKTLDEFLVCLSGSFDVMLDDGREKTTVRLDRPWRGLHVPPLVWAVQLNFEPGSVCMVLASAPFDETDYYRDYDGFLQAVGGSTRGNQQAADL